LCVPAVVVVPSASVGPVAGGAGATDSAAAAAAVASSAFCFCFLLLLLIECNRISHVNSIHI
jgi:hypothetical protein